MRYSYKRLHGASNDFGRWYVVYDGDIPLADVIGPRIEDAESAAKRICSALNGEWGSSNDVD